MSVDNTMPIEKHLLSLSTCGCYINTQDIVMIGEKLGLELAYKKRSMLLQTLFLHAKNEQQHCELVTLLCTLLDEKANTLLEISTHYPKINSLMQHTMLKINATKLLLQRELALYVKESNGND
ncbi:MAG: hypothetical protein PHR87_10260 [Sulfurospirillaceae bacterium]|nr:hypothetical protein [Sulfurospirillaceae bacterium]